MKMINKAGIKVRVPAAISDFSIGYSIAAAAVENPSDELIAHPDDSRPGVWIEKITGFKTGLSLESNANSACLAGQFLLDHLGISSGIRLQLHKGIVPESGLSSNAASAVGGVFAVNELLGRPLERYDLLPFALKAAGMFNQEAFPAQVCAQLFGGILLFREEQKMSFQKIYAPKGIQLTIVLPILKSGIIDKRNYFPEAPALTDYQKQIGQSAAMVAALYESDFELFSAAMKESSLLHPYGNSYGYFKLIREIADELGAFGCNLAGRGPAVYIASPNTLIADEIALRIQPLFASLKLEYQLHQTKLDLNGVHVC